MIEEARRITGSEFFSKVHHVGTAMGVRMRGVGFVDRDELSRQLCDLGKVWTFGVGRGYLKLWSWQTMRNEHYVVEWESLKAGKCRPPPLGTDRGTRRKHKV